MRLAMILTVAALTVACQPPAPLTPPDPDTGNLPPARVDLPPIIPLEGTIPPETHPDHTMRIDGLLARRDKYLGQKILVRGYVVEKYDCPLESKICEHPHAWLADSPAGGDKKLMLVHIDDRISYALQVGQQYVVTGKFDRAEGGFVRSSGLLIQESVDGLELPEDKEWKRIEKKMKDERRKAQKAAEKARK